MNTGNDYFFEKTSNTTDAKQIIAAADSVAGDYQKSTSNDVTITITKENTSFDFANKYKEFLINGQYQSNPVIDLIKSSSNDIGRLIYERIQNFLNNCVNIDSCSYQNLISHYKAFAIDIDELFIKGLPDELHFLIDMLSLPKAYYKSLFYQLYITDSDIHLYKKGNADELLEDYIKLNRKYFDNFYENVAYPIICKELLSNTSDTVKAYIKLTAGSTYSQLIDKDDSSRLLINLVKRTMDQVSLGRLTDLMTDKFLLDNPDYVVSDSPIDSKYISSNYFNTLITSEFEDTLDMSGYMNGYPANEAFNYYSPSHDEVLAMFEHFAVDIGTFIDTLSIRLVAKKIANACNQICKLREELKSIKEKDTKVGTAVLIEQLITEFILKNLTKKVGLSEQKMLSGNIDQELDDELKGVYNEEQRILGIEFEKYYERVKALANRVKVKVVEYYDTTPSYLNIIPENNIVKSKQFYNTRVIECPPYLNINGDIVYPNFDNTDELVELDAEHPESFKTSIRQCATGDEKTGYSYYINLDNRNYQVLIDNELGFDRAYILVDNSKKYLIKPDNSQKFIIGTNINRGNASYNRDRKWFQFVDEDGSIKIIDMYDRSISWTKRLDLLDNSNSSALSFVNGQQQQPLIYKYIIQNSLFDFRDYYSGIILSQSSTKDTFTPVDEDTSTIVHGLFVRLDTGESLPIEQVDFSGSELKLVDDNSVTVYWQPCLSATNNVVTELYNDGVLTLFYKSLSGEYAVTAITGHVTNYIPFEHEEFRLEATGEFINCTVDSLLYNSDRLLLNYYESDLEVFYKQSNCKIVFKDKQLEILTALDGNQPFWNDIAVNVAYSDKTVDEEADIIKFYQKIGLIDADLPTNYKAVRANGSATLTKEWINARTILLNRLKQMWSNNAVHRWYNEDDSTRFDKETINNLKNMDIAYHSNIGSEFENNGTTKLNNSITNLENWENNTVAIHPCVWNLVEKATDAYIKLYSISLYGEEALNLIYSEAFSWPRYNFTSTGEPANSKADLEGLFAIEKSADGSIKAHNVNYWNTYSHSMFPYTTKYEHSGNSNLRDTYKSRFIDFDGPFNYEALMAIIDKTSISADNLDELQTYYIGDFTEQ